MLIPWGRPRAEWRARLAEVETWVATLRRFPGRTAESMATTAEILAGHEALAAVLRGGLPGALPTRRQGPIPANPGPIRELRADYVRHRAALQTAEDGFV